MRVSGSERLKVLVIAAGLLLSGGLSLGGAGGAPEFIDVLHTKTASYTNVTITAQNKTGFCIAHDGGVGNIYMEDLDEATQQLLGYAPPVPAGERIRVAASEQAARMMQSFPMEGASGDFVNDPEAMQRFRRMLPMILGVMAAVGLIVHLVFSYCSMLICRKAGTEPGLMVWLPILQVFPLLRAAGMSGWWFLGLMLPVVNLIASILWCFNIVSARGKGTLWAVLLIVPFVNIIAFFYLAFSGTGQEPAEPPPLPRFATV